MARCLPLSPRALLRSRRCQAFLACSPFPLSDRENAENALDRVRYSLHLRSASDAARSGGAHRPTSAMTGGRRSFLKWFEQTAPCGERVAAWACGSAHGACAGLCSAAHPSAPDAPHAGNGGGRASGECHDEPVIKRVAGRRSDKPIISTSAAAVHCAPRAASSSN